MVSSTICWGWLQIVILLISASWVARITGVSHWHPTSIDFDRSAKVVQGRMESLLQLVLEQLNVLMEKGFFFFSFFSGTGACTQGLHFKPLHQPYFCIRYFWDRVLWTICWGWLWTMILLISASWVAGIIGVSYWGPVLLLLFSFLGTGDWTRVLTHTSQVFYHWTTSPASFFVIVVLLWDGSHLIALAGLKLAILLP
jgi:hypothetical protein